MNYDVIYTKDCSNMEELESESINLIISGPPYWELIDYDAYIYGDEFIWKNNRSYEDFFNDIEKWYKSCFRVLSPGRYCVVNIGTVRKKGRCYPIPFHTVKVLEKIGFEFCYEIIWHKITGGRRHARGIIQRPYPGYYIPNNRTEYLLVFKKEPWKKFCKDQSIQQSSDNKIKIDNLFKREISNNIWHIQPSNLGSENTHPCPFPPEIPYRLIQLMSLKGEVVLDPFMGIGTTARVAKILDRRFIGYEIRQQFVDTAYELLKMPITLRPETICRYERYS